MDYNATTPVDPEVFEEMKPYFCEVYGNASSANHKYGWEAEEAVSLGRRRVADLIGAIPREIVFTAGSTESNNIAIKGIAEIYRDKGNHIITCTSEHKAILETCESLESKGIETTYLKVDENGLIDLKELEDAITDKTILVSIMAANNEIGTLQPVKEIGKLCREKGVFFHTDATQAVGKIPMNVDELNIDMMSISAHKFYGPKGVGALYVRSKNPAVKITKQMHGGSQEKGMRSGTLNVPGIVGFGKACEICLNEMEEETARVSKLRDKLQTELLKVEESYLNGDKEYKLPHVTNISFKYVEGEGLMMGFNKNIALSSGSACTSASLEPSYVLKALGLGDDLAHSSLRFGLGRFTTEEQIDFTIEQVTNTVNKLREMSPLWEMFKEGIDLNTIEWAHH